MEVKININDLNEIIKQNKEMRNLLIQSESTLARMQRRLPDSKQFDTDAQACAGMRELIAMQLEKKMPEQKQERKINISINSLCQKMILVNAESKDIEEKIKTALNAAVENAIIDHNS